MPNLLSFLLNSLMEPCDKSIFLINQSSSSCYSLATLYHPNNSWTIILALCALDTDTGSIGPSQKILVRIACSTASMVGDSCSNINVTLNLWTNSSHRVVSLYISNSKYQLFGIVSNVCINMCIHSISGNKLHKALHCST
jgi:hypothetical protein